MSILANFLFLVSFTISYASAAVIATINPCPQDSGQEELITVTSQYQTVSTCIPQAENGKVSFSYSQYAYVSTLVPCKPYGTAVTNVLVTDTAQWVTITRYPEETHPPAPESTVAEVVQKQALARYNELGGFVIPGWAGSGLCTDCVLPDGSQQQRVHMQECDAWGSFRECFEYDEIWYSYAVPDATTVFNPACTARSAVNEPGTYTFTFPQPAFTNCVTPTSGPIITITQPPWNAFVTKTCGGPTTFDFTTTVTQTITLIVPYQTDSASATYTVTNPPPTGFPPPGSGPGSGPGGYPGDGPTLTMTSTPGSFTTLTASPGGSDGGLDSATITIAQPTGSIPGTVIVINPTSRSTDIQSDSSSIMSSTVSTGPFTTLTITPTGTIIDSATLTITLNNPSGSSTGTVVVIDPGNGSIITSSTGTSSTPSNAVSATITSTSATTLTTVTTSCSGSSCMDVSATITSESLTTLTTVTTTGALSSTLTTVATSCSGLICVDVSATITIPVGPSSTSSGTGIVDATDTSGAASATSSCSGLLCASVGVSDPTGGATITAGVGSSSAVIAISDPLITTTLTVGLRNPTGTTTCDGILCASVGVSDPIAGATITAGAGGSGVVLAISDPVIGATITAGIGGSGATTTCDGLLCASIGISDPTVGATITAGVGTTSIVFGVSDPIVGASISAGSSSIAVGISDPLIGTTLTLGLGNPTATTTCDGILCASVGISDPIVGATITAGVGTSSLAVGVSDPIVGATLTAGGSSIVVGVSDPIIGTTLTIGLGNPTATTTCDEILCASVGISDPIIGATVTAGVGTSTIAAGVSDPIIGATVTAGSSSIVIGVSDPIVGATLTAGGSSVAVGISAPIVATTLTVGLGGPAAITTCDGILCASVGVSNPIIGATVTAGVGSSSAALIISDPMVGATVTAGGSSIAIGISNPVVGTTETLGFGNPGNGGSQTTPAATAGATTPCVGLLCASVGVQVLDTGATATVGVGNGQTTNREAGTTLATVTTPRANSSPAGCVGALCVGVSASLSLPLAKRSPAGEDILFSAAARLAVPRRHLAIAQFG